MKGDHFAKTTDWEEKELRMVCSQVCVELIPLSSKTKGSRLDGGSPRSEGNVFIDDSVGGGSCEVIQQRQRLQGGPPRLLGRRPMGRHPFEHQDPFEIYITFLPYGLLWSGERVDTKWPMGTTGSGTAHAQKSLSAAEDARKIRRPSILFSRPAKRGKQLHWHGKLPESFLYVTNGIHLI